MNSVIDQPKKNTVKIETAIFQLVDTGSSGFIQEGTEMLAEPVEKKYPTHRNVLRMSHYRDPKNPDTNIKIRYVNGIDEINLDKQIAAGVVTNQRRDMITFKDGYIFVAREGKLKGLVDYLRKSSFCETNPNRDITENIIWREIFPEETQMNVNKKSIVRAKAVALISSLIHENGEDSFEYDMDRIDALCSLLGTTAETPATKVNVLIAKAEHDPEGFMRKVELFDKESLSEIAHAIELGVISVEDTSVSYVEGNKVLITYPSRLSKEQIYQRLAGYFQSYEGANDYREFKVHLNHAKEKAAAK